MGITSSFSVKETGGQERAEVEIVGGLGRQEVVQKEGGKRSGTWSRSSLTGSETRRRRRKKTERVAGVGMSFCVSLCSTLFIFSFGLL